MGDTQCPASLQHHGPDHRKLPQVSNEGYEDFLKDLGVSFLLRKAAMASTPVMTITESGGNWTMVTKTSMKSIELKFRPGEEFEEDTTDGRHCKTTVTLDGDKMTTTQIDTKAGGKNVTAVREFNDEGLVLTTTCNGVSSVQKFKRD